MRALCRPGILKLTGNATSAPTSAAGMSITKFSVPLFADIDDVAKRLAETGYLPDTATATAVFLADRLGHREGHFFPAKLLDSQLATLEALAPDEDGVVVDMALSVEDQVEAALRLLGLTPPAQS